MAGRSYSRASRKMRRGVRMGSLGGCVSAIVCVLLFGKRCLFLGQEWVVLSESATAVNGGEVLACFVVRDLVFSVM